MLYTVIALIFCFGLGAFLGFEVGRQFGIQSVARYTAGAILEEKAKTLIDLLTFIETMEKEPDSKD